MRATVLILGLALHAAHADAHAAAQPDSASRLDPGGDLDFLVNDDEKPSAGARTAKPRGGTWIYWAAAGAAAACGGFGWYWYEFNAKPAVTRNEQTFTDAR